MRRAKEVARGLTERQRFVYFKAHRAACIALGLLGKDCEEYRRQVMREECGVESTADMNRTSDFDACVARFWADAGDLARASNLAVGDTKRHAFLVKVACCQILQLMGVDKDRDVAVKYLRGLLDQARIANGRYIDTDTYWLDVSPRDVMNLLAMLDTHRRRLVRRALGESGARDQMSFSPRVRYRTAPYRREPVDKGYYDALVFKVNIQ